MGKALERLFIEGQKGHLGIDFTDLLEVVFHSGDNQFVHKFWHSDIANRLGLPTGCVVKCIRLSYYIYRLNK